MTRLALPLFSLCLIPACDSPPNGDTSTSSTSTTGVETTALEGSSTLTGVDASTGADTDTTSATTAASTSTGAAEGESTSEGSTTWNDDGTTGVKFDVGTDDAPPAPANLCKVQPDAMNAPIGCTTKEDAPDTFAPVLEWSFGPDLMSTVTPLVGNFTDDNGDGEIDLCDTPDVLLLAASTVDHMTACELFVIDGATGVAHFAIPKSENLSCFGTPAFADIDGDGMPEIVAVWIDVEIIDSNEDGVIDELDAPSVLFRLKAFEHDGSLKWSNTVNAGEKCPPPFNNCDGTDHRRETGAIAIHDLDADGDAEIIFNHEVYDHNGVRLWAHVNPRLHEMESNTAADLDGDGKMEVITGHAAYHHDGTVYWDHDTNISQAIPHVANLDDDPQPEVLLTSAKGQYLLEHNGAVKWGPLAPTGVPVGSAYENHELPQYGGPELGWLRPATIYDFDGDGEIEYAHGMQSEPGDGLYALHRGNPPAVVWATPVYNLVGAAGGTAFDFLGDGVAEVLYADQSHFHVLDGATGEVVVQLQRYGQTLSEYPVVADIDNDGSAEILLVSSKPSDKVQGPAALRVFGGVDSRWAQARRIWNQHSYHITNINEDGTLPQTPVNNWETLNTFRTNSQIENGRVCKPQG